MADYRDLLGSPEYQNWIKCALAVNITAEGLRDFVKREIRDFQNDTFRKVCKTSKCNNCKTSDMLRCPTNTICRKYRGKCNFHINPPRQCPQKICNQIKDEMINQHRFGSPSWKNTDATKWCTDEWEIAKCYFPRDGYKDVHTAEETDFNGIIGCILNCKRFEKHFLSLAACSPRSCHCKFHQAREKTNANRHSPDLKIDSNTTTSHINTLVDILGDLSLANDRSAGKAINRLQQLKKDTLTVSCLEEKTLVEEALDQVSRNLTKTLPSELEKELTLLKEYLLPKLQDLERRVGSLEQRMDTFEQQSKEVECKDDEAYENLKKDLQGDLLKHYKERFDNLPLSVLSVLDVPLNEIYVPSRITVVPRKLPSSKQSSSYDPLERYEDIFCQQDMRLRNIYIQGDAGQGKSTFSNKLVIDWHDTLTKNTKKEEYPSYFSDKDYLELFQFVFLITLRNLTGNLCDISDIILSAIVHNLPHRKKYDADFLERLFLEEDCLIILDGLDEWKHSDNSGCLQAQKGIPHRSSGTKCTFVTLTRPWRLNDGSVRESDINALYSLNGVVSKDLLLERVIGHLNKTQMLERNVNTFKQATEKVDSLLDMPILATQLICLWYETNSLAESRCQLYFSMIEMLGQKSTPTETNEEDNVISFPMSQCTLLQRNIDKYKWCLKHSSLLECLGKLAFYTLHSCDSSTSIVFSPTVVKKYMDQQHIATACSHGILSQHRLLCLHSQASNYTFVHKTYQEFFAAYYLAIKETKFKQLANEMLPFYKSHSEFMGLYVFVCGLNPSVSKQLCDTIFSDETLFESFDVCPWPNLQKNAVVLSKAGETEHIENGYTPLSISAKLVVYDSASKTLFSPFSSSSDLETCIVSTITCLFLQIKNNCKFDFLKLLSTLENLKSIKLIDLHYENYQCNQGQMIQKSVALSNTLTRGRFIVELSVDGKYVTRDLVKLDMTGCSNLTSLVVISYACSVNINSTSLKEIVLVSYDMTRGNVLSAIDNSKTIETLRMSNCRFSQSTLSFNPKCRLHFTGTRCKHESKYTPGSSLNSLMSQMKHERNTLPYTMTFAPELSPYLILSSVKLCEAEKEPSSLNAKEAIDEKSASAFILHDSLKNIVLYQVEYVGNGMRFPSSVCRLVMVDVSMSFESWNETLSVLPTHLEQLILRNNTVIDPAKTFCGSRMTEVLIDNLQGLAQKVEFLYVAQAADLKNINITLSRSLKKLYLEGISMLASSWCRVINDIGEKSGVIFSFLNCKIYPVEESCTVKESLTTFHTKWNAYKEYVEFSAGPVTGELWKHTFQTQQLDLLESSTMRVPFQATI